MTDVRTIPGYWRPNPRRIWRITNRRTHESREVETPSWLVACWDCQWDPSECRIEGPRGIPFHETEAAYCTMDDTEDGHWQRLEQRQIALEDAELDTTGRAYSVRGQE